MFSCSTFLYHHIGGEDDELDDAWYNNNFGETYVLFGGANVGSSGLFELEDIDGSNGFVLNGIDAYDQSGYAVSGAGDINGDGYGDMIVGAVYAEVCWNGQLGWIFYL